MTVERLDKGGYLTYALNALGYKIDFKTVEIFLNLAKHIEKKGGDVNLKEVVEIEALTKGLFGDES